MTATLYESHAMRSPYDRWHSTNYVRMHELYWMNCVCSLHMWQRGPLRRSTAWPRQMARLQSSTGELLESRRIWPIHRAQGLPGCRLQLRPGGRPTDKSMCLRSTMCAATSLSSQAKCPKTEMQQAARISPNGVRPVCAYTSTLLMMSHQWISSIWCWHFKWKA